MPHPVSSVYLNTAGCGLIPETVRQAGIDLYQAFEAGSSAASEQWRELRYPEIKKNAARLMHTEDIHVAFLPNFSFGINALVHALKGNERVLLYRRDFPSLYLPFFINQFEITWIDSDDDFRIDMDRIESLIRTNKIDIVVMSHVQWQSGFKMNLSQLGEICQRHGAQLIVDATQSLGAIDIDLSVLPVDVLIASNYKWMNAGFGTGLMYMHPAFIERYPPRVSGNAGRSFHWDAGRLIHKPAITDYEPGSLDMFGLTVMNRAVEEKLQTGLSQIEAHNRALTIQLLDQLAALPVQLLGPATMDQRASIVCIRDEEGLHALLQHHRIVTTQRNGLIRISIHAHNTAEDIEVIAQCIRSWGNGIRAAS